MSHRLCILPSSVAAICLALAGCSANQQDLRGSVARPPQEFLKDMEKAVRGGSVAFVEVLYIPPGWEFVVGPSPATLKRDAEYIVSIPDVNNRAFEAIADILSRTKAVSAKWDGEVRLGLIFHRRRGLPEASGIFLDSAGGKGVIEGRAVQVRGPLAGWLKELVSGLK